MTSGIAAIEAACEAALQRTRGEFIIFARVGAEQVNRSHRYSVSWKRAWRDELQYITSCDRALAVVAVIEAWAPPDEAAEERSAAELEMKHALRRAEKAGVDISKLLKDGAHG